MKQFQMIWSAILVWGALMTAPASETNRPVVAIYDSDFSLPIPQLKPVPPKTWGPQIIAAVWADGRVIWSATNRGAPYYQARISSNAVSGLLAKLERNGVFTNQALTRAYFGPDSSFRTIVIQDGLRHLEMRSWHEGFEANSNLVAKASGIESLAGRSREQVLQEQPAEYRSFRRTWSEIRQAVRALVPPKGEPYHGEFKGERDGTIVEGAVL